MGLLDLDPKPSKWYVYLPKKTGLAGDSTCQYFFFGLAPDIYFFIFEGERSK